ESPLSLRPVRSPRLPLSSLLPRPLPRRRLLSPRRLLLLRSRRPLSTARAPSTRL
ncbi:hypothetical protein KEM55_007736, partial [Ascosphaera atra]